MATAQREDNIPDALLCPISRDVMNDPVIAADGNTYEREAIEQWIARSPTSPLTRERLGHINLISNRAIKQLCDKYRLIMLNTTRDVDDGVCITISIDRSGSMATTQTVSGENCELSILQVVKHAVRTIIRTLRSQDRLSIIDFNDEVRVLFGFLPMTEENKTIAWSKVSAIEASGTTNMWGSIVQSLRQHKDVAVRSAKHMALVLTDGIPNVSPARGEVMELKRYVETNGHHAQLCMFGFGYKLNSSMLSKLAIIGNGSNAFIPDLGMVGTCFINAIGNILSNEERVSLTEFGEAMRVKMIEMLRSVLEVIVVRVSRYSNGANTVDRDGLVAAQDILNKFIAQFNPGTDEFSKALLADLKGEIHMAINNANTYLKWGRHFLRSFLSAHSRQECNNFKDKSVQFYGSEKFKYIQNKADEIFNNMPPPKPTVRRNHTTTYRGFHAPPSPPSVNMRNYNNASGGCFHKNSKCTMKSGDTVSVSVIKVGDTIATGDIDCPFATVKHVIRSKGDMDLTFLPSGAVLTSWHPVHIDGKWQFPGQLSGKTKHSCDDEVYNFVLDKAHTIKLQGGDRAVTLGHGLQGDVVGHPYFGDMVRVQNDLKQLSVDETGSYFVTYFKRDSETNMICGMH